MDEVLYKVGLPVKCKICDKREFIKPHKYNGWYRYKRIKSLSWWYCPDHAKAEEYFNKNKEDILTRNKSLYSESKVKQVDSIEELYKLLD